MASMTAAEIIKGAPDRMFNHVMKKLEPSLLPGSVERIKSAITKDGRMPSASEIPGAVLTHIHSETGSKNLKSSVAERVVTPPRNLNDMTSASARFKLVWKDEKDPLARVIDLLPIKAESRQKLLDELSYEMADRSISQMSSAVMSKIDNRDFREANALPEFQLPVPESELRLRGILHGRFGEVGTTADRDAFARSLASQGVGRSEKDVELVNSLARSLAIQGKISHDDPRKTEREPIGVREPAAAQEGAAPRPSLVS